MSIYELVAGAVYGLHMRGIYGQTKTTYLGEEKRDGRDTYAFYDGECRYSNIADASKTIIDRAQIMHFTEEEVEKYVSAV